jgi:hypothetical protein
MNAPKLASQESAARKRAYSSPAPKPETVALALMELQLAVEAIARGQVAIRDERRWRTFAAFTLAAAKEIERAITPKVGLLPVVERDSARPPLLT